jgi:predicted RNase H-like nuclease (RuvC/YqgF family)
MKMAQYWEAQENRWHDKYIEAEGLIDQLENKIWEQASEVELLKAALRSITKINNKRDRYSSEIDAIVIAILGDDNV